MSARRITLILAALPAAALAACATDSSDYAYSESVSTTTRTVVTNHCPNHQYYDVNPNTAIAGSTTYTMPYSPVYNTAQQTSLASTGSIVGVAFSAGMIYSAYGGSQYGTVTGYSNSAPYAEGDTFDMCGGHSSSTSDASYHYHIAPSCLLKQLGQTSGQHSPQIGWMADGFPLYGPLGPGGVAMKTCTQTGNVQPCTDDCAGYYADTGDGYEYRYYVLGTFNDGTCCTSPSGSSVPGEDYYPFTPLCLMGCCPSGVTCSMGSVNLPTCSGGTSGATSPKAAQAALSTYTGGCDSSSGCCDSSLSDKCGPSGSTSCSTCTYSLTEGIAAATDSPPPPSPPPPWSPAGSRAPPPWSPAGTRAASVGWQGDSRVLSGRRPRWRPW